MLKVMTIVGTRPEIIRLSRIIPALDHHFDHSLIHTGQNFDYELNKIFFSELKIREPNRYLDAAGTTAAETIGNVIIATDKALNDIQPDAVLILGDTNSCLAAISAKRRKIPIFHMEAGNRCFDFTVPEEINRRIVDHVSDINLTYSEIARQYLVREGISADQIIVTGSPMKEVLQYYSNDIAASKVLNDLSLQKGKYFLVSAHREENVDNNINLGRLINILNSIAAKFQLPVIVSTHPRTRKRMEVAKLETHEMVKFNKPFGFIDYVHLQLNARAVLSDSGTITEESSILNFPALNLREIHERPEGFEEAAVMLVGLSTDRVLQGLEILDSQARGEARDLSIVRDYDVENVSAKVMRIILSYTDVVNRRVWRKDRYSLQ